MVAAATGRFNGDNGIAGSSRVAPAAFIISSEHPSFPASTRVMADPASSLIDPTLLFRFEVTLRRHPLEWTDRGLALPEACRLPAFGALAGQPIFADIRMAWGEAGVGLHVRVSGKRALPWCRETRPEESDGFHLWLDTRCSPGIQRATQYCHRFLWMPAGAGPRRESPLAALLEIPRARGNPKPIAPDRLRIASLPRHDGYELSGVIPAGAMTGFDSEGQPRVGLYYAVADRELGWQTLCLGPQYPAAVTPSLWGEAVLEG